MKEKISILFVAAECAPLIKVGGLGDVACELPIKLKELGFDVRMTIPAYKDINAQTTYVQDFPVNMGWRNETCIIREVANSYVTTYLVDNYHYFGRSGVYGHRDDAERFAFFCNSVYKMLQFLDYKPDVIHLNDWHTAPLAMLIRENENMYSYLADTAVLYTIHSLEYQGISGKNIFNLFGVKDSVFIPDKVEYYDCFNAMKAGIHYSDLINGVSRTFSQQMLTKEYGFGLDGFLKNHKSKLRGIVNGINYNNWDPGTDDLIYKKYHKNNIECKKENKYMLQKELGLECGDNPLFCVVSRLVPNKGLKLMEGAVEEILKAGGQFVLLGSGEKYYEIAFLKLASRYPGKISVNLEFNNEKAHKIYAGSDALLMPSRYEPCGLSQLIAMRYGCIPIVHKTGGLADTVKDEGHYEGEGNGFAFSTFSLDSLLRALKKTMRLYKKEEAWKCLIYRAMNSENSWENPVKEYIKLYKEAILKNIRRKTKGRAL